MFTALLVVLLFMNPYPYILRDRISNYAWVIFCTSLEPSIYGGAAHTWKKRVMWRGWLFWPKKFAEKVRKSRQNVNRDKSA